MLEKFLNADFWSELAWALAHWQAVLPLLLIAFGLGWLWKKTNDSGEMRGLRARNEALEAQRDLARNQNDAEKNVLPDLRAEIASLQKQVSEVASLKPVVASVDKKVALLAQANQATSATLNMDSGMFIQTYIDPYEKLHHDTTRRHEDKDE